MKIALVILHADPARGGAERYTVDLAGALSRRGHDVALVASSFADIPAGVEAIHIDAAARGRLAGYRRFLDGVETHVAQTQYDVVHAMLPVRSCDVYHPHAGLAAEGVASGHLKHRQGIRRLLAAAANRLNRKRQAFSRIEREMITRPDGPVVLCLSEYVKETVRRHYALPAERMATLFNAVDLRRFDPAREPSSAGREMRRKWGIADDRVVALMIAQDFARKGLREAILALRPLSANEPVTLLVVGRGDIKPYEKLARQAQVADRVIFAGPTADPYSFYLAADLFLLPTRHDPCSLVVLESLAMGVPVISTVLNGACEIMKDGVHGFVLRDPGDVEALTAAVRYLMSEPNRKAARNACLQLRPELSFDAHVERLIGIYRQRDRRRG